MDLSITCFGDSHAFCFVDHCDVQYYPGASARGLSNMKSTSETNSLIRELVGFKGVRKYIFFFGKVDIDFILNHKYNLFENFDATKFITETVSGYMEFVKSLNIAQVYICELPLGHFPDEHMLAHVNDQFINSVVYSMTSDVLEQKKYDKCIPLAVSNQYLCLFNSLVKNECLKNNFGFLEINKHFVVDGEMVVPREYIQTGHRDIHLKSTIAELYMKELCSMTLP